MRGEGSLCFVGRQPRTPGTSVGAPQHERELNDDAQENTSRQTNADDVLQGAALKLKNPRRLIFVHAEYER